MISLTSDQKKKIKGEIETLSEVISDLASAIEPGQRGGITLAEDDFRNTHGVDLVIECPLSAEKYIQQAFMEFDLDIKKSFSDNDSGYILGLTLEQYKHLLKGSIILFIEYQKELATKSPEGKQVKFQIKKDFANVLEKLDKTMPSVLYH